MRSWLIPFAAMIIVVIMVTGFLNATWIDGLTQAVQAFEITKEAR